LGEGFVEGLTADLAAFCAETTGFLAASGFRVFSLSSAKLGSDIKAKMHKGKQELKTRQENSRFSGFKALLSRLKVIRKLASLIETCDSVPK
jgi:hypothetical protein